MKLEPLFDPEEKQNKNRKFGLDSLPQKFLAFTYVIVGQRVQFFTKEIPFFFGEAPEAQSLICCDIGCFIFKPEVNKHFLYGVDLNKNAQMNHWK